MLLNIYVYTCTYISYFTTCTRVVWKVCGQRDLRQNCCVICRMTYVLLIDYQLKIRMQKIIWFSRDAARAQYISISIFKPSIPVVVPIVNLCFIKIAASKNLFCLHHRIFGLQTKLNDGPVLQGVIYSFF